MINADNRVTEVIIGLLRADANACYEYARPQSRAHLRALANGACMVDRIAHHLECLRPDELMVWEFPEEYDPLPGRALPDAIDAGAVGDNDRVWACLEGLAFEHLAATASAAAHLERSAMLTARKLGSYPRQNGLAIALRELGRIERTLFILDWLQNVELRRRVHAGLNKGEARNTRARAVFFNRLGEIRDRSFERRRYRASGLNLVTAAIVLRNTAYLERITTHLCDKGGPVDEELLQYLSPLGWDHIYLTGDYVWQQNRGIAPGQCRPLRATPNA